MLEKIPFIENLFQLQGNLYLTDFLDIAVIALLIYSLFLFFRRTRTYMVFLGLSITFGLYVIAETLNLYLTFITLRYFVGVSIIVFVIVFQGEIRKYFEFLGLAGTRQIKRGSLAPKSPSTGEIIQACVKMAQAKIGALIVIQGKDSLDSFIDGGVTLDGVISEDVILSIFDPHSDGHDGAMIVNNDRISKFGAHLPLSTNFKEIGKHGTRHSAALGLTENSDSLCVVCSEEKGKISVCKDGKLKTLLQFGDLEKELEKFIKAKFVKPEKNKYRDVLTRNLSLKAGAMALAIVIWFFTAYQAGMLEKSYTVPIVLENTPKDIVIKDYTPKTGTITLSGRGDAIFSGIKEDNLKIKVDVSKVKNGVNEVVITEKNIDIPANTFLVALEPSSFVMNALKYNLVKVPVVPRVNGAAAQGYRVSSIVVDPDEVEIWVPEGTNAPTDLSTDEIGVSDLTQSLIIPAGLQVPKNMTLAEAGLEISISVTVEKEE